MTQKSETADEILSSMRKNGWMVAVHNDYRLAGVAHTFYVAIIHEAGGGTGWDRWQAQDIAMLTACDKVLVYRLPGWDVSKGVAAEIAAANKMGKPVEYIDP